MEWTSIPDYITLSYCWGVPGRDVPPPRTTRDTYGSMTKGIEWSDVPTLFQDAILLTRALGCRYLWADSLCIVQDDEQDWIEQSATMADVYSHGYITLPPQRLRILRQACFTSGSSSSGSPVLASLPSLDP